MRPALERVSRGEAETRRAGFDLARWLSPGDLVLLEGDLGSGKTVFARGLAAGLGAAPDEVASPTFALVHEYGPEGRDPVLLHADLYRLADDPAGLSELGIPDALRRGIVVAIEWPRPPFTELPAWWVTLRESPDGSRTIRIRRPPPVV